MKLEQKEKDRFLAWLAQEIMTEEELLEQLEKLGGHHKTMVEQMRIKILAYKVVAQQLLPKEEMTIGG